MPVITVLLEQEQIDRTDRFAAMLTRTYGVKTSRAAVIRLALEQFMKDIPPALTRKEEDSNNDRS